MYRRQVFSVVAVGIVLAAATSADSPKPWDLSLAPLLEEMGQAIDGVAARVLEVQETLDSEDHLQTQFLSKRVEVTRDVEFDRPDRIQIVKIPVGQKGFLDQASCVVLDAPIWDDGGGVSVHVSVESPTGESRSLCSLGVVGKPFSFFAEFVDQPLKFGKYPLKGGETVSFSCRSFMGAGERVLGKGCTVDVDLWLRLETNRAPPEEEIPSDQAGGA